MQPNALYALQLPLPWTRKYGKIIDFYEGESRTKKLPDGRLTFKPLNVWLNASAVAWELSCSDSPVVYCGSATLTRAARSDAIAPSSKIALLGWNTLKTEQSPRSSWTK